MKRFVSYLFVALILFACERDSKNKESGCITGNVTFFNTGKVTDAYVRLMLSETTEAIYSGKIGLMGNYKIDNVEPGSYIFKVYKMGFIDTVFPERIKIQPAYMNGGDCRQMDWTIAMSLEELKPLRVLDVNTNDPLDTLDFGTSIDRLYFKIRNDNNVKCHWNSDFYEVSIQNDWLSQMKPQEGIVEPYSEQIISVEISRSTSVYPWDDSKGEKSAIFKVESNMGGWVMTVLATIE